MPKETKIIAVSGNSLTTVNYALNELLEDAIKNGFVIEGNHSSSISSSGFLLSVLVSKEVQEEQPEEKIFSVFMDDGEYIVQTGYTEAEALEKLSSDGRYKVAFVDEGNTTDLYMFDSHFQRRHWYRVK